MANTRSMTLLDAVLEAGRTFLHQKYDAFKTARTRRKIYRRTYSELSALSTRDLADLGIPRGHIKRLALEAAYGC